MCELVVWKVSQQSDDPYIDAQCWKAGDVICAVEDGHEFSAREKANADWRIVKLPGVPASAVASLLAAEPQTDPAQPNRMCQRRMHRLDLTKRLKSLADVNAARVKKLPRPDPNVID
jgi:hypothetical protein